MTTDSLVFEHPNPKGTGSAIRLFLVRARYKLNKQCRRGQFWITIDPQKSGGIGFDEEKRTAFCLDVTDVGELLWVFRGCKESAKFECVDSVLKVNHRIEPTCGYEFRIECEDVANWFVMTTAEAVALSLALEQSMAWLAFGIAQESW